MNRYQVEEQIGKGGMGVVYRATDTQTSAAVAIKEERLTKKNREMLQSEALILQRITHPAFPKYYASAEKNGVLYLVMEYVSGRTLQKIVDEKGKIDEQVVRQWFLEAADALAYLHGMDPPVIYRDFKPENLMLDDAGRIRIIDLGIAEQYRQGEGQAKVLALTRGYAAPEQYSRRYRLDERTDIYALAVTMHYLVTGKNPNEPPYNFRPARQYDRSISLGFEYVLKKCLQPNPDKRYRNATLLAEDLRHLDEISVRLQKRRRTLAAAAAGIGAALVLVLVLLYRTSLSRRNAEIDHYYALIEQADTETNMDAALKDLNEAVSLQPDNPDAYVEIARTYQVYGEDQKAIDYINETIAPRFEDIYSNEAFLELVEELDGTDGGTSAGTDEGTSED